MAMAAPLRPTLRPGPGAGPSPLHLKVLPITAHTPPRPRPPLHQTTKQLNNQLVYLTTRAACRPARPAAADCTRLLLLGEIQAAADFPRDRLYIEYVVRWDPDSWQLTSPWPQPEPGIAQVGEAAVGEAAVREAAVGETTEKVVAEAIGGGPTGEAAAEQRGWVGCGGWGGCGGTASREGLGQECSRRSAAT